MIMRRILLVAGVVMAVTVLVLAFLVVGSRAYTNRVLASWEEERANLTGPLMPYPAAGVDKFDSSTTLGFVPLCQGPAMSTVIADGPTTVRRETPVIPPDGQEQIPTELVEMTLQGTFGVGPLVGPVTIRESPDRRSLGRITQINPGEDFPAESFFDVFFEVELPGGIIGVNREPVPMRRIIWAIPPLLVDYLPPPDLLVHLYEKDTDRYWGCMVHPNHSTIPPVHIRPSIPDPIGSDLVHLDITVKNPDSQNAVPVALHEQLDYGTCFYQLQPSSLHLDGPGSVYPVSAQVNQQPNGINWEADNDPLNGWQPVQLDPLHQAVIGFDAFVFCSPGQAIPNIAYVTAPPIGLNWDPITMTMLVPGNAGNLTEVRKEAQPFVKAGELLTYTIILPNTGVVGTAYATMTDEIPPGTTYVSGSVTGGAAYDAGANAIVMSGVAVSPVTTKTITFQVRVTDTFSDSAVLTNTAVITDNWGNEFRLDALTVVVDNALAGKSNFEDERNSFPTGLPAPLHLRVVDRQGVNVADGMQVRLTSSGGTLHPQGSGLLSAQDSLTVTTQSGLVSATLSSAISQTIVVTAETTNGLIEAQAFSFQEPAARLFLPTILKVGG